MNWDFWLGVFCGAMFILMSLNYWAPQLGWAKVSR